MHGRQPMEIRIRRVCLQRFLGSFFPCTNFLKSVENTFGDSVRLFFFFLKSDFQPREDQLQMKGSTLKLQPTALLSLAKAALQEASLGVKSRLHRGLEAQS